MKTELNLLLLTDFSEVSGFAASYALQIAKKTRGKVEIMHILQTPVDWVKLPKEREHLYPEVRDEIAKSKAKLSDMVYEFEQSGISTVSTLLYSFGPENVFAHVKNSKADLVVMGSQGKGASRGFMLGSNAQKVLRNVKNPTLVVKKNPLKPIISKIGFLSTLEQNQMEAFEKIKAIAELLEAELDLVFINTPYNFLETEDLEYKYSSMGSKNFMAINALNMEKGILYYTKKHHPDLLVLAKSEKPDLVRVFSPSLTENLVREQDLPILSIPIE